MLSLLKLFELQDLPWRYKRGGRVPFGADKVNAAMFAWFVFHDGEKPPFIPGRVVNHPEKNWKGMGVDKVIPTKALDDLYAIKQIQGRASCQGTLTDANGELEVPTYYIFRPLNQDKRYVETIVNKLNKYSDVKSNYDIGLGNEFRIGVVGNMSYETNPKSFTKWWNELPIKIKKSL
jgi:hypothetical protein